MLKWRLLRLGKPLARMVGMKRLPALLFLALLGSGYALVLSLSAPLAYSDDEKLKDALEDKLLAGEWIYDDIEAGYAQAEKAGKPLLVTFKCVP